MQKSIATFSLIIIGLFAFIQTAFAELEVTEEERAVFAYFKLTDQKPDYEQWIKNSTKYQEARGVLQDDILSTETERLSWGFETFDLAKGFITITRPIRLTTVVNEDGKRVVNTRFVDERHNETPYFPISYGNESIAFIIEGLEQYRTITLKPEEVAKIKEYFFDASPYEAVMELRIRPLSADAQEKLFVDYKDQWLMLGDIAYLQIKFYDEYKLENITVWDYNAPWYLEVSQKALLEMFKNTDEE